MSPSLIELPDLRDRRHLFRDRAHAGEVLAGMLAGCRRSNALVMAIPAGGAPVAAALARELELPLDVCVVSKILLPWTTEAGFGAVAFDGTTWLNREYVEYYRLTREQVAQATAAARRKVTRRVKAFRGERPLPCVAGRPVILVDDGLASGATLRAGMAALRRQGADQLLVAVPTAHLDSALELAREVEAFYCANIRSGPGFAVADAYRQWYDVSEDEAAAHLSGEYS